MVPWFAVRKLSKPFFRKHLSKSFDIVRDRTSTATSACRKCRVSFGVLRVAFRKSLTDSRSCLNVLCFRDKSSCPYTVPFFYVERYVGSWRFVCGSVFLYVFHRSREGARTAGVYASRFSFQYLPLFPSFGSAAITTP